MLRQKWVSTFILITFGQTREHYFASVVEFLNRPESNTFCVSCHFNFVMMFKKVCGKWNLKNLRGKIGKVYSEARPLKKWLVVQLHMKYLQLWAILRRYSGTLRAGSAFLSDGPLQQSYRYGLSSSIRGMTSVTVFHLLYLSELISSSDELPQGHSQETQSDAGKAVCVTYQSYD